jgi:hypothetical protein
MSWQNDLAATLLPVGLTIVGSKLKDKDKNDAGPEDAFGNIMLAMAPIAPSFVSGGASTGNATLKAMRAIEQAAHAYRVQVGDVQTEEDAK